LRVFASRAEELHAPCIALAEVLNAVWKHVHLLRDLDTAEARRALRRLRMLRQVIVLHGVEELGERALDMALGYGVTLYDALYIALAEQLGQPFYTFDARLAEKLRDAGTGIQVVVPSC